jgi:hypothetical protein
MRQLYLVHARLVTRTRMPWSMWHLPEEDNQRLPLWCVYVGPILSTTIFWNSAITSILTPWHVMAMIETYV